MIIYDSTGTSILGVSSGRAEDHYNLGIYLQSQNKYPEAIRNYYEALRINPDLAQAHGNLATIFYEQNKIQDAINHYKQALKLDKDLVEVYCNLGNAFCDIGDFKRAIIFYKAFIEQAPPQYATQSWQVEQLIQNLEKALK